MLLQLEQPVDLLAVVGDEVFVSDPEAGVLARPGLVLLVGRRVAAAARRIDRHWRGAQVANRRRRNGRQRLHPLTLRGVLIKAHRVGRRVDDRDAGLAGCLEDRLHLLDEQPHALRRARHQCLSHMSQMTMAVLSGATACEK